MNDDAERIARILGGAKKAGTGWNCLCPVHDDAKASLNIAMGNDSKILVRCYAGCEQDAVLDALRARGLMNGRDYSEAFDFTIHAVGKPVHVWTYRDPTGARELLKVARYVVPKGKEFRPWTLDAGGRWKAQAHPVPRPLYRLELLARQRALPVLVVEGEKTAEAAGDLLFGKYVATTWSMGAGAAGTADWKPLQGRTVVLWPDADVAGHAAMQTVAAKLAGVATKIAMVDLGDDRPKGWDLADAKAEGWTADDVLTFIDEHARPIEVSASPEAPPETDAPASRWQLPEPITAVEWETAKTAPDCVVENYLYADVGVLIAPGGTGKTTLELYEAIHIALGLPLYGLQVLKPGPVLILSAEDSREMLVGRLRCIGAALDLSDEQKDIVRQRVRISDECGTGFKLTRVIDDVVMPTLELDALIREAQPFAPVVLYIDPAVSFGIGETRVNDAEQGLIEAGRRARRELGCCVRLIHHSGKQNARDKAIDQYAGRGGSTMPDGARMVAVLQPLTAEEWHKTTGANLLDGETGMVLARPKLSFAPPQPDILVTRKGYRFTHTGRLTRTKNEELALNCTQILLRIHTDLDAGLRHTQNSLAALDLGMSRAAVRDAVQTLIARRQVEHAPIDPTPMRGPRSYLRPVAVPTESADSGAPSQE